MPKKIGYQGVEGSFSYITLHQMLGARVYNYELISCFSFVEMFEKLQIHEVDYILIPLENSLAGSVVPNYELLLQYEVRFIEEQYTQVELQLISHANIELKDITKVFSHPKALEQCAKFFLAHPWMERVEFSDTASSVQMVSQSSNHSYAAIASKEAAAKYGLNIVQSAIQDEKQNWTRFMLATRKHVDAIDLLPQIAAKIKKHSLILTIPHRTGSLNMVLYIMAEHQCNLTKIESRPKKGTFFEYNFFIDMEMQSDEDNQFAACIHAIKKLGVDIIDLGMY
jgi:prephenate dehydratase